MDAPMRIDLRIEVGKTGWKDNISYSSTFKGRRYRNNNNFEARKSEQIDIPNVTVLFIRGVSTNVMSAGFYSDLASLHYVLGWRRKAKPHVSVIAQV